MSSPKKGNAGRPTKYQSDYPEQASKLCRLGAIDRDIANFFGISESTLNNWKLRHPEFLEALKRTREEADAQVERSLFQRALGYSHRSEKVFQFQGQIIRAATMEHYPPDTAACFIWLKNRCPQDWSDRRGGNEGSEPPKLDDPDSDIP